jgi:hypothetical protein
MPHELLQRGNPHIFIRFMRAERVPKGMDTPPCETSSSLPEGPWLDPLPSVARVSASSLRWGARAPQPPGALLDTADVQRRGHVLQDSWVACASHQAARCLEEHIERSDPKEEIHEDYSTQYRARRTGHEFAVHGRGEPAADSDAGDEPAL